MTLTQEQVATNAETWKHIHRVQGLLLEFVFDLLSRAHRHDQSKLRHPEVQAFTEHTANLATTTYGSEEYNAAKVAMGAALQHHYANNRHHPEHFENGVNDMNLLDLVEMFADWKAASERHNDGNVLRSIELNTGRFRLRPQLVRILENTAELFGDHP